MSLTPRFTMIGFYNYDSKVFDELDLPEDISKPDFINAFLLKYGECPVIYPNWGTCKFAIGVWSKKWYNSIERIIEALTEEYNPLYNFDRHEEYTDIENKKEKNELTHGKTDTTTYNSTFTDTDTRQIDTDGTTTNEVSAYNATTYQDDNKTTIDNTEEHSGSLETVRDGYDTIASTGKDTNDMTGNRGLSHTGHLYGNIGVTESTTMLQHELDLRRDNNILDIVADMLYKEICIYVY